MCVNDILQKHKPVKSNLIQILHEVQDNHPKQYLTEKDLTSISEYLNITMSEVYGVVKYYTMFSTEPRGKYIIRICKSPVCGMMGANSVKENIESILKIKAGKTTKDGLFTLEESECLGYCNLAPMLMINKDVYGDLTPTKIKRIIEKYKTEK